MTSTTPVTLFLTELKMLSQHKAPIHTGNIITMTFSNGYASSTQEVRGFRVYTPE